MKKENATKKTKKKPTKTVTPKEEKVKEVAIEEEKKEATSINEKIEKEQPIEVQEEKLDSKEKEKGNRVLGIIKKILLIVTSPIWFPWKILFIKKEGNKFKDVSSAKRIFRIVRAPITKTLKFLLYICIIGLEIFIVYKIRYSVLTYPLTKNAVQNHYLSQEGMSEEYRESLKEAFNLIDDWDLDSKNKMYVIFDSDIVKTTFRYVSDDSRQYIMNKFNEDEDFREDVRYTVENIDNILARAIKEIPESISSEDVGATLAPLTNVGANAIDYRAALDILGTVSDTFLMEESITAESIDITPEELDQSIEFLTKYARGMSLEEAYYSKE